MMKNTTSFSEEYLAEVQEFEEFIEGNKDVVLSGDYVSEHHKEKLAAYLDETALEAESELTQEHQDLAAEEYQADEEAAEQSVREDLGFFDAFEIEQAQREQRNAKAYAEYLLN